MTDEFEVFKIELRVVIDEKGNQILKSKAEDPDGNPPALILLLGALELARDTFIRQYMGEIDGS